MGRRGSVGPWCSNPHSSLFHDAPNIKGNVMLKEDCWFLWLYTLINILFFNTRINMLEVFVLNNCEILYFYL